jgi:hypothetical protein
LLDDISLCLSFETFTVKHISDCEDMSPFLTDLFMQLSFHLLNNLKVVKFSEGIKGKMINLKPTEALFLAENRSTCTADDLSL